MGRVVIAAIRDARADIVGLQEAEGNTRRIAEALGWPYWSDRLHVVSRYPLIDPPAARGEYVLANERATRLPEIRHALRAAGAAARDPDVHHRRLQHAVASGLDDSLGPSRGRVDGPAGPRRAGSVRVGAPPPRRTWRQHRRPVRRTARRGRRPPVARTRGRARQRGRRVRVAWHSAPACRRDWIGIWNAGGVDLYNDYLTFAYTGATVAGSTTITGLKPGRYVARLMKDDRYAELAKTRFTVAAP